MTVGVENEWTTHHGAWHLRDEHGVVHRPVPTARLEQRVPICSVLDNDIKFKGATLQWTDDLPSCVMCMANRNSYWM